MKEAPKVIAQDRSMKFHGFVWVLINFYRSKIYNQFSFRNSMLSLMKNTNKWRRIITNNRRLVPHHNKANLNPAIPTNSKLYTTSPEYRL